MLSERSSWDLEPFMHRRFPLPLIAAALAVSTNAFAQNELVDRANANARPPIAPLMPNSQPARSDEDGPFSRETPATFVAKKTRGAVVMLRAMQSIPARLNTDDAGRTTNLGAGVIFDKRGYIVTNYHVVANVQKIDASWPDGRVRTARRVNYDAKADLAVLKLEGDSDYPVVSLSEGVTAIEGEVAIAVGNPYGLGNSLAWGIVSHVGRDMKLPNNEMGRDLIQVSAAINPGNSGGPLFNVNGQLLGITAAIRSNSQGIAFAITTKRVLEVVKNLMPGPISLGTMGLAVTELRPTNSNQQARSLVQVSHVEAGSPASRAGLTNGDRIDSVDDQVVRTSFDLERALWDRKFGDSLTLKINGRTKSVTVPIGSIDGKLTHAELVWSRLGIWALEVPASRVRHLNPDYKGGLLVVNVAGGSVAEKAGLLPGDIVLGLIANGEGLSTVEAANFTYMMREDQKINIKNSYVDVLFMRDGELAPQAKMYLPADR
jgi:serine protease Do